MVESRLIRHQRCFPSRSNTLQPSKFLLLCISQQKQQNPTPVEPMQPHCLPLKLTPQLSLCPTHALPHLNPIHSLNHCVNMSLPPAKICTSAILHYLQDTIYNITTPHGVERLYCVMNTTNCGNITGGWMRAAYIDMSNENNTVYLLIFRPSNFSSSLCAVFF